MSELVITPNFDKKTARFKGTVAAGEHATVRIVGAGELTTSSLRLRVLVRDPKSRTLAVFPLVTTGTTVDEWEVDGEDLTCTLNINTTQAQKCFRRVYEKEVLFVLDDPVNKTLFFSDLCVVRGWPLVEGADVPVDLDGYDDFVASMKSRLEAVESAAQTNAAAISAEATARQAADALHVSQISGVSDAVSTKAEASALEGLATKTEVAADKAELESAIANKQDAGDYLTEHQSLSGLVTTTQMNAALAEKVGNDELANLATKEELATETDARESADAEHDSQDAQHDAGIAENAEGVQHAEDHITNHALDNTRHITAAERTAWNGKADQATTYTKSQVDAIVQALKNGRFSVVSALPAAESAEENVIYLLSRGDDAETGNVYDEYIVADGAWEKIGSTQIDLSNYVQKETGKGLSTNDYTGADKAKVAAALTQHQDVSGKLDGAATCHAWDQPTEYSIGDVVLYKGRIYRCRNEGNQGIPPDGELGPNVWEPITIYELLEEKQDALTETQLAAANSGATAAKVATWDGYAAQIAANANASDLPYAIAPAAQTGGWQFSGSGVQSGHTYTVEEQALEGYFEYTLKDNGSTISVADIGAREPSINFSESGNPSVNITATRAYALQDRTNNKVPLAADSGTAYLQLPPAVPGKMRDLLVRVELATGYIQTPTTNEFKFVAPPTGETVSYEPKGGEMPYPEEDGTYWFSLSESDQTVVGGVVTACKFAVSMEKLEEVS